MSKKEKLLKLFNKEAPIAKFFGMILSFNKKNQAVIDLPYNSSLDHALKGVHGGIYCTLLDNAGWFTAAIAVEESYWLTTSQLTIHFLEPVKEKDLQAIGKVIKQGRRQIITEMNLYDSHKKLVAFSTGTFIILSNVNIE